MADMNEQTNEKGEEKKNLLRSHTVLVEHDRKAVATEARARLVAMGWTAEEAERQINRVWKKFCGREYRFQQFDDWHTLTSPLEFLTGALISMAQYDNQHATKAEWEEACERDSKLIRMLMDSVTFGPATKYDKQIDFVLGQEQEAQNRIAEYLQLFPWP